jgi:uncharacterized delta-60 repeat protein
LTTGGDDSWSAVTLGPNSTIVVAGRDFGPPRLITAGRLTAAGVPDTTFSGDGLQTVALGDDPRAEALAVDGGGTTVVAGTADMGATGDDVALIRFSPNGAIDTTWASSGTRTTNFGYGGGDAARTVRAVAGGKTLAVLDRGAARYLADGSLDPSYGAGGVLTSPISGPAAITPNGGLVVVGYAADDTLQMRRYTAAGVPDATGTATLSLPEETEDFRSLNTVLVAPNGSIVITGSVGERVFAARYLSTGAKDTTFSGDGYAEATPIAGGSYFLATGAALQDNGKVLVTGYYNMSGAKVVRFTSGGQLDAGFGTGGVAHAGGQFPGAVTVDNAGRIIVAGTAAAPDFNDSAVARLTPTGAPDTTFSGDGIASVNLGANDYFSAVTVDSRDRVIAAGTRGAELDGNETIAGGPRATVARFRVDGALDQSFNGTGSTVVATGRRAELRGVAIDDDGNVIGAGEATATARFGAASDALLTRLLGGGDPDGDSTTPDTTFTDPPATDTEDTTPEFAFAAVNGPATFECRVDAAEFAPCSSPHTTAALTGGAHTFDVRAIDASGNVDRTPAHVAFQVTTGPAPDTTPPSITITKPSNGQHFTVGATVASSFHCTDAGGSGVASCSGPAAVDTAAPGPHAFTVTATDVAGNTATKTANYIVDARPSGGSNPPPVVPADTTAPTIVVPAGDAKLKAAANGRFPFSVGPFTEATTGTVTIRSVPISAGRRATAAKKVVLKLGTKPFTATAGSKVSVRFKLSKKHRKLLTRLKQIRMRATIIARDTAGNAATLKVPFTLKAPKRKH